MHLIEPKASKRKWDIRLRNHDGRIVKISGDEDPDVAKRIGDRVLMLIKAKQNGDPPPSELGPWIENMTVTLAERLIALGLLPRRRFERGKTVAEHIEKFRSIVADRKGKEGKHARTQASRVRQVCEGLKVQFVRDLDSDAVLAFLNKSEMATSTRRGFIIALKDFAKEMVRLEVIKTNPFEHVKAPGQYENPEYERQPLTVDQFKKLMAHLETFTRYKMQKARWTAHDRKMIFWTAVKTGYRQSELRAIRRANLHLDGRPAIVSLKARHTKNKTEGDVPIPRDLADALRTYVADLEPNDRVFPLPSTSGSIVDMMRRDLTGAGIPWQLPTGEIVDFHTLRSTAITWWLDVENLSPKRVQVLARLKTLALVYRYSRNLRIEDFAWLENGPLLVESPTKSNGESDGEEKQTA